MNLEKVIKYSVPLFVLAIVSRSIEEISFIYYAVPVMSLVFIVLQLKSSMFSSSEIQKGDPSTEFILSRVEGHRMTKPIEDSIRHPESDTCLPVGKVQYLLFLLPGIWFLLTSLWSSYPEISAARALYFILISLGSICAGMLWIKYSDKNILSFLLPANLLVVLISLFSLITNIPSDSWSMGRGYGFGGFFGHQNLLASVLLFTVPSVFFKLLQPVKRDPSTSLRVTDSTALNNGNQKSSVYYLPLTVYCLLLIANLLVLTLTYSRSAIVAFVSGAIVYLILNRNWKVLTYSFATAMVIGLLIYSIPSLKQAADKIVKKDFPEIYSSRMWMWEPSYKAALEGGLFGLGYGISHPEIRSGEYSDRFENGRLIREKGNSTLALIEEIGLIGLILFMLPLIVMIGKSKGSKIQHPASSILFASLAAFILHAQFEAWWVGVGSVQLPLFYIYIGLLVQGLTVQGSRLDSSRLNGLRSNSSI